LIPLLSLSEEQFRRRFRGSPILRAKRRGFLRNVAVALGNLKDTAAVPALSKALEDRDSLVRSHAAWALGQIGGNGAMDALIRRLSSEEDAEVKQEIEDALQTIESTRNVVFL
jgi:epoxyqueuosine reductase